MTEMELFKESSPMIAEIIFECRKLSKEDYENFKNTTIKEAPKTAKRLVERIFIIIEHELRGMTAHE